MMVNFYSQIYKHGLLKFQFTKQLHLYYENMDFAGYK
jgi:hypothetical protein